MFAMFRIISEIKLALRSFEKVVDGLVDLMEDPSIETIQEFKARILALLKSIRTEGV